MKMIQPPTVHICGKYNRHNEDKNWSSDMYEPETLTKQIFAHFLSKTTGVWFIKVGVTHEAI